MTDAAGRSLRPATFRGWPAWRLQQQGLCLHIVPSVGGRLMGIAWQGHELCFVHDALAGQAPALQSPEAWAAQCVDWHFPLWGGGKAWIAPQADWPDDEPHRDLDSGAWTVDAQWCDDAEMGLRLTSPVCRRSGLQVQRTVVLTAGSAAWRIEHSLFNRGSGPQRCGLWDVLMLRRPGRVLADLRQAPGSVSALPGQPGLASLQAASILALQAPELQIDCAAPLAFKCGLHTASGALRVQLPHADGHLIYARQSACPDGAPWAHGHPLEVFNAPALPYFEIESHSPLVSLQPGDCLQWTLHEQLGWPTARRTPDIDAPQDP